MNDLSLERWRRIDQVFSETLERPAKKQAAYVEAACGNDTGLRDEVLVLLESADEASLVLGEFVTTYAAPLYNSAEAVPAYSYGISPGAKGRYEIIRELGRGGMGAVYLARDPRLERLVALKFLPPHLQANSDARGRFLTEARAASALDHLHIGTIYEIVETDDDQPYIVMAFYEGETLKQMLASQGHLPVDTALTIARQVAEGLAEAHRKGIIHRDIKPANILVARAHSDDREGGIHIKILDFGVAKISGGPIVENERPSGTPCYMSPEQLRGKAADARTDCWAMGVVLYEMLAGAKPFAARSMRMLISLVMNEEPAPLINLRPDVPAELTSIIDKALAKDPAQRYEDASEMLAELLILEESKWRRTSRKPLTRWHLTAAACLLAIASGMFFIFFGGDGGMATRFTAAQAHLAETPSGETHFAGASSVILEEYRKGRYSWSRRDNEGLSQALVHFNRALALDPNFAPAWAGLADTYVIMGGLSIIPSGEAFERAFESARHALALNDSLAEAHAALALTSADYLWDWDAAERHYRRALAINPDFATAHHWYSEMLSHLGRHEEAIRHVQRARDLDPHSLIINADAGRVLIMARRYEEAIMQLEATREMDPYFFLTYLYLGVAHLSAEEYEEATRAFQQAQRLTDGPNGPNPQALAGLGYTFAMNGQAEEARRILGELLRMSESRKHIEPWSVAIIYTGLGEMNQAIHWLEVAYEERSSLLVVLDVLPLFDPLRGDPRFIDLLRRVGFEA